MQSGATKASIIAPPPLLPLVPPSSELPIGQPSSQSGPRVQFHKFPTILPVQRVDSSEQPLSRLKKSALSAHPRIHTPELSTTPATSADILGLWRGLFANILLCTNPAIQFAIFEMFRVQINRARGRRPGAALSWLEAFAVGGVSKAVATIITYPLLRAKIVQQTAGYMQLEGAGLGRGFGARIGKEGEIGEMMLMGEERKQDQMAAGVSSEELERKMMGELDILPQMQLPCQEVRLIPIDGIDYHVS